MGLIPTGINDAGEVVGSYLDSNVITRGFLRANRRHHYYDRSHRVHRYLSQRDQSRGGHYRVVARQPNAVFHGFLRSSDGTLTTFDVPGSRGENDPSAINPRGRSQDPSLTRAGRRFTASSEPTTVLSPPSIPRGSAEPESYTSRMGINLQG